MGSDGRPTVQTSKLFLRAMTETAVNTGNVNVTVVGNAGIPSKSELEELNEKTWFGIGKFGVRDYMYIKGAITLTLYTLLSL